MTSIADKVTQLKAEAEADELYTNKCLHCGCKVIYAEHDHALEQGHIYSADGRAEYRISRMCEYCFDSLFPDGEVEVSQSELMGLLEDPRPFDLW